MAWTLLELEAPHVPSSALRVAPCDCPDGMVAARISYMAVNPREIYSLYIPVLWQVVR